ncbi:hypothetical protein V2G26_011219 [Clonostachys chloroleuca]|uniref:FAR-17a/AIG1-like protein n=1 Tax=Clonostachys rhizophaga TaxID=160324 RepID=A0A9N9YX19_9HYPO|nr:unnamed protein product [Clonostachys rhizophaga]
MRSCGNPFALGTGLWDPSHRFETSWLLSPWLLFACRFLIGIYALVTRLFLIGYTCTHDGDGCTQAKQSFSYFTILTFWGIACYFLVAAFHTFFYALRGRSPLESFPRFLQALHSLFYTTIVTYPFLVTIVYWVVLFRGPWFDTEIEGWSNVTQHGLNSAFALFEIFIPRTEPMLWIHLLWVLIMLAAYLGLAYLTYATQGFYVYSFLDPRPNGRGMVAAYAFGILAAILIIFCIVYGLIWVRKWFTEKKLGMDGKFAHQRNSRPVEMSVRPKGGRGDAGMV